MPASALGLLVLVAAAVSGCGQKGPLVLPDRPAAEQPDDTGTSRGEDDDDERQSSSAGDGHDDG